MGKWQDFVYDFNLVGSLNCIQTDEKSSTQGNAVNMSIMAFVLLRRDYLKTVKRLKSGILKKGLPVWSGGGGLGEGVESGT